MSKRLLKRQNRLKAWLQNIWGLFSAWWHTRRLFVKITVITAVSLLALTGGAVLAVSLWVRPPDDVEILINLPTPSVPALPSGASPPPSAPPGADEGLYTARGGVYTFLLAGVNEGMADTLMVATLDIELGTCHVLSIPRDTVVARAPRSVKKISSAYSQRRSTWDDEPGIPQLKKEVSTLIGFQPQYTAIVDYSAFLRLVAAIGGVEFNVPMRMYVPSEGIDLRAGVQTLNANQALQLVRFRYDHRTGAGYDDYGRMKVQQQFLAAAAKEGFIQLDKIS
jgi:LCP family protein required for cell wall assembly